MGVANDNEVITHDVSHRSTSPFRVLAIQGVLHQQSKHHAKDDALAPHGIAKGEVGAWIAVVSAQVEGAQQRINRAELEIIGEGEKAKQEPQDKNAQDHLVLSQKDLNMNRELRGQMIDVSVPHGREYTRFVTLLRTS